MNPDRDKPGRWNLRKGHMDEISEQRLTETMEMLQRVADNTNTELEDVINVYGAAVQNRLTEVLLASGDAFDSVVDDIKKWKRENGYFKVMLAGDYNCDEVRVKMINDD